MPFARSGGPCRSGAVNLRQAALRPTKPINTNHHHHHQMIPFIFLSRVSNAYITDGLNEPGAHVRMSPTHITLGRAPIDQEVCIVWDP